MSELYQFENIQEEEMKRDAGNNKKNRPLHPAVKRVGAIVLSAALFGGVAAGTFQGINRLAGYPAEAAQTGGAQAEAAQTGTNQTETQQKLLKTASGSEKNKGAMDVTEIAKAAMPSVVAITSYSVQEMQDYFGMFGRRGWSQPETTESCGSGIIVGKDDEELLILTNYHVIEGADTLSVCFGEDDEEAYEATVKGDDADKDLAVIAVSVKSMSSETLNSIKVAAIGDSDALEVGEQVVAIGNALGYGQSVTTGIVSATGRTLDEEMEGASYDGITLIQTDAAINPGNSGGALLNMNGEVVGINSAKLASTEVEGMGYAIAINDAYETIQSLMNMETRTKADESQRASIGISGTGVSEEVQEIYGLPKGVFVAEVTEGGAAQAAGIEENSIITAFDGKSVEDIDELKELLTYYKEGETVDVTVMAPSEDGYEEKTCSVTLGSAKEIQEDETEALMNQIPGFDYDGDNPV